MVGPALLLLTACNGCNEIDLYAPQLTEVDLAAASADLVVEDGGGVLLARAYARAADGALVPGLGAVDFAAGADAATADADAYGWAEASLDPGVGAWTVTATTGHGTPSAGGWVYARSPGTFGHPAWRAPADAHGLAAVGGGVVTLGDGKAWWRPITGGAAHALVSVETSSAGLYAGVLDGDGVADLLVWDASHVYAVRGRPDGGAVVEDAWTTSRPVVQVLPADLDGDPSSDLVVLFDDGGAGGVALLSSDGQWAYAETDGFSVDFSPVSASVEDYDRDGAGEVTLLTEDGLLRRFQKQDDAWISANTQDYSVRIGAGGRMAPSVDLTGDDSVDLLIYGPVTDGTGMRALVATLGSATPVIYDLFNPAAGYPETATLAVDELDGDGVPDVLLSSSYGTTRATFNPEAPSGPTFATATWSDVEGADSIALVDATGDGDLDLLRLDGGVDIVRGGTDGGTPWQPAGEKGDAFGLLLDLPPMLGDLDGDGLVDLLGLSGGPDDARLGAWLGYPEVGEGDETFVANGGVDVGSGGAVGWARCERRIWVATDHGDGTYGLVGVSIDGAGALGAAGAEETVAAGTVVCGDFGDGVVRAAVVDPTGVVTVVGADLAVAAADGGVAAVAADRDGDGVDEVYGCASPGCTVVAADLDDDGGIDLASSDGARVVVTRSGAGGPAIEQPAAGATVSLGDVDGDGVLDLTVGTPRSVHAWRGLAGALVPAVDRTPLVGSSGHYGWGDLDGDTIPDLFAWGAPDDTTLRGAVIYSEATAP